MTANTSTPRELGYRFPAEWEPHAATWLAWPHNRDTWPGTFDRIVPQYARFARTIAEFEPAACAGWRRACDAFRRILARPPRQCDAP